MNTDFLIQTLQDGGIGMIALLVLGVVVYGLFLAGRATVRTAKNVAAAGPTRDQVKLSAKKAALRTGVAANVAGIISMPALAQWCAVNAPPWLAAAATNDAGWNAPITVTAVIAVFALLALSEKFCRGLREAVVSTELRLRNQLAHEREKAAAMERRVAELEHHATCAVKHRYTA